MDHILFDGEKLRLLDQRKLPRECAYVDCRTSGAVVKAIQTMVVRGAPAIGVAGAFGCVLAAREAASSPDWRPKLAELTAAIATARPTAVNLAWAVDRMNSLARSAPDAEALARIWQEEARRIHAEDIAQCKKIGAIGSQLISDGDVILTHCNAGALATAGYGTALGVIRSAWAEGKKISVIADETRPLLQGARLTAWELARASIPVRLACDNAAAHLLSRDMVNIIITGADRIAANGDTANKIGTCGLAILAHYYNVPFYIAAPLSTIDCAIPDGGAIPVETRASEEVLEICGSPIAPSGIDALNFAFDITPASLIAGIITETGILRAPYQASIAKACASSQS